MLKRQAPHAVPESLLAKAAPTICDLPPLFANPLLAAPASIQPPTAEWASLALPPCFFAGVGMGVDGQAAHTAVGVGRPQR